MLHFRMRNPRVLWLRPLGIVAALMVATGFRTMPAWAAPQTLPAALSALQNFRGTLAYTAHPAGDPSQTIAGSLAVTGEHFALDERSNTGTVHVSEGQSWLASDGRTLYFDDALGVSGLANAWVVMLADCVTLPLQADPSGRSWTAGSRVRVYPDVQSGDRIIGLVDIAPGADASFSFGDWQSVNGLALPASVVQLRGGIAAGAYVIDRYQVTWAPQRPAPAAGGQSVQAPATVSQRNPLLARTASQERTALRLFGLLIALLAVSLGIAAWLRRDAFTDRLCRRLASDPRAWRDEGTTAFVSPEGILWFGGRQYRVGSAFFNRRALVQSSTLFIRISAAGTGLPLVMARKFPRHESPRPSRSAAGFTLVEALVATALFASVVVAAVFPTLVVLAHADRVATLHEAAVQVAANALVDEEAALAYGSSSISDESSESEVDGLRLTVAVTTSSINGMHQITATVADPNGAQLARIATMVGPPVPAPDDQPQPPGTR